MVNYRIVKNEFKLQETYYTVEEEIKIKEWILPFWSKEHTYYRTLLDYTTKNNLKAKFKTIELAQHYIDLLNDKPVKTVVA